MVRTFSLGSNRGSCSDAVVFGVQPGTSYRVGAMSDAEQFDAFHSQTRDRLPLLTFALTVDLRASRGAVRDGFVPAWHYWRKVKRLPDPEGWVRPHVWSHAQ